MRRGGADRQIGILPRIAERRAGGFGHPFDFERENPQTLHDLRYAGRNHPQILAAGQHRGRIEQRREFAQRFVAPEVVVATVEKLLVQPVERPLLRRREPPVGEGRLRRDTRMVMPETFTVFEEEYVVEQTQQSVADAALPSVGTVTEKPPYAPLRRRFGAQRAVGDVMPFHLRRGAAEEFAQYVVGRLRTGVAGVGQQKPCGGQLLARVGQRRPETAEQTVQRIGRYLPDAEETEDVVDAVDVEILPHFAQPRPPPAVAVARHRLPVVGREAPVLPRCGKGVGRRSGLPVEMEEVRILPYVGARRTDADRNIAFEDDAPLPCVTAGVAQLAVQMILQETVEIDRCPIPVPEYAETLFVVTGILAPLPEIGRTEAVAQGAERGVGFQPQTVLRLEGGIAVRRPDGLPRPAEKQPCPVEFQPHDRLVIDGGQGVEPSLLATVAGIGLQPRPDQAQVERMEGETRNGVVGIGVASRSRADRIVDRQQLYDPLPRSCGPVDQFPQVGEFARTETRRRTQRKERQGRTCAAPCGGVRLAQPQSGHDDALSRRRQPVAASVLPLLPHDRSTGTAIEPHELVFERSCSIEHDPPEREIAVVQCDESLPAAQFGRIAGDGQHFVGAHGRRFYLQFQPPMPLVERFPVRRSSEDRPRKGRGVKRRIRRPIRPAVADRHPRCAPLRNHLTVGPPFAADRPPVGLHFVTVFDVTGCERRAASPYAVAPVLHRNAPFAAAPDEPLPPLRAVFDLENHLHAYSSFRIKSAVSARVNAISASGAIRICKPRTPALT